MSLSWRAASAAWSAASALALAWAVLWGAQRASQQGDTPTRAHGQAQACKRNAPCDPGGARMLSHHTAHCCHVSREALCTELPISGLRPLLRGHEGGAGAARESPVFKAHCTDLLGCGRPPSPQPWGEAARPRCQRVFVAAMPEEEAG